MSGLSGWTEAHRAAYTISHLSTRLARQAMGGIDALDPDLAAVLKKNGLYDRFELLGKMIDEVEGEHYVIPENAYRLTDDDLAAYLPDSLREKPDALTPEQWEAARADGFNSIRQKLAQDVMGYFADETSYAVLEPDAKTRAAMYGNTRPGTKADEMLLLCMAVQEFSVTYWQRILGESRCNGPVGHHKGAFRGWLDSRRIMADVPCRGSLLPCNHGVGIRFYGGKGHKQGKDSPQSFEPRHLWSGFHAGRRLGAAWRLLPWNGGSVRESAYGEYGWARPHGTVQSCRDDWSTSTGKVWRSRRNGGSDDYQQPAVCKPLVSAGGHGTI